MVTFSDYYSQMASATPRQGPSAMPKYDVSGLSGFAKKVEESKPYGPIETIIDILSRPLYGVTNAVTGVSEGIAEAREGNPLAAAGGVAAIPTNFLSSFFGLNGEEGKRTFSTVLEEQTDRHGKINDPNYQDTEDNVNPVAKGVLGFIGDVALDPLTWIPGAQVAKVGGMLAKGGKAAVKGAENAVKGVREAEVAAKTADEVPTVRIEEENPFGDGFVHTEVPKPGKAPVVSEHAEITPGTVARWASESDIPEVRTAWLDYNAKMARSAKSVSGDVAKGTFLSKNVPDAEKQLTKLYERYNSRVPVVSRPEPNRTFTEMFKEAGAGPAASGIRQELSNILSMVGEGTPVAAKPIKDWIRENASKNLFEANDVPSPQLAGLLSQPGKTAIGSVGRLATITGRADLPMPIRREADTMLKQLHSRATAQTKTAVTDSLMAFNLRRAKQEDDVRAALGDGIYGLLESKADGAMGAKAFEKALQDISRIVSPDADIAAFNQVPVGVRNAVTEALGLPKYIKAEAGSADETAQLLEGVNRVQTPADEVLLNRLGTQTPAGKELHAQTYPESRGGTEFTSPDREVALGRKSRQLNSMFQYDLNKSVFSVIERRMAETTGKEAPKGLERTRAFRSAFYETWDALSRSLDGLGVKLHVGVGKQRFVPLSYRDVVDLTEKAFVNEPAALSALFNAGTSVPPSRLMEAVHWVTTTGARGDEAAAGVREILANRKLAGYKGQVLDQNLPSNLLGSGKVAAHFLPNAEKAARQYAADIGGVVVPAKGGTWSVRSGKGGLLEPLVRAVTDAADSYALRAAENAAAYKARGIVQTKNLTEDQLARIASVLESGTVDQQVEALAKLRANVGKAGAEMGAYPSSVEAARHTVEAAVGGFEVQRARYLETAKNAVKSDGKSRKKAVSEATTKVSASTGREADEVLHFEEVAPVGASEESAAAQIKAAEPKVQKYDMGSMDPDYGLPELAAREGATATALGWLNRTFNQRNGMKTVFDIFHAKRTVAGQFLANKTQQLRELAKFTPEQQVAAMKAVQVGAKNTDPAISEAMSAIETVMKDLVDMEPGSKSLMNSSLLRTEPNLDHINEVLASKLGKESSIQFKDVDDFDDLADQWRSWEFTDPMRELYSISDALATVAEHRSIVGNFLHVMGKAGGVSTEAKPGFVKVVNTGRSKFAQLIPDGTYLQRDVAAELHNLDIMLQSSRKFSGELGEFFQKSFIPAQNIWKQAVTVYRLGHHVRNEMSNDFMSYMARGTSYWMRSQKDAMKVLGLRNEYEGANLIDSLTAIGERIPVGDDVIVGGSRHSFTADELAKIFQDSGLKSTFNISEDLMQDQAMGKLAEIGMQMTNSRLGQMAGGVSHMIDHKGKMQHLIQILHQEASGKGKWGKLSKAELIRRAVQEVKRSHPDSLMLTPTEAKWRFLIPFYTWFAKTLPFAMESAVRNPGRLMTIPKASYNLAVAMGINPNNLSDPFPDDQLFPSFVTNGAFGPQFKGPDGEYVNINPGVPQFDLLQQLLNPNPVEGVLGMTSPLLRVPAELATGSKIGGKPITDTSDYLDQNIPIINYLANLTGTSVTGSAASLLQGQGLDPQAQVAKGNKTGFDQTLTALNWLTGVNAQNWSRPNFINYAEIEKRNRASGNDRSGF